MKYPLVRPARFLRRPNRFVAYCELEGREEMVHVKNTGRCRELLQPGATVYLVPGHGPGRKTAWDLVAVEKQRDKEEKPPLLVNMDSQAPNQVLYEALAGTLLLPGQPGPLSLLRREVTFGDSRFDLYLEAAAEKKERTACVPAGAEGGIKETSEKIACRQPWRAFVEVKGVTLEEKGICRFPDAPTLRGTRHLRELIRARKAGYAAYVIFIIQMEGMEYFTPHTQQDPDFALALKEAAFGGVTVLAYDCRVEPGKLELEKRVEVRLEEGS